MKSMYTAAAMGLINQALADTTIMPPPATATGDDVAIVWIHGANCETEAYETFASEIQSQGSASG